MPPTFFVVHLYTPIKSILLFSAYMGVIFVVPFITSRCPPWKRGMSLQLHRGGGVVCLFARRIRDRHGAESSDVTFFGGWEGVGYDKGSWGRFADVFFLGGPTWTQTYSRKIIKQQHLFEKAKICQIGKMNTVILNVKVAKLEAFFGSTFSDWKCWNKWGKQRRWLRFHHWDVVCSSMISMILSESNEQNLTFVSYNNTMLISIVY